MEIIIKGRTKIGKTRSEQESNIRKEWGSTMSDENLDKLKHLEKKMREEKGAKESFFTENDVVNMVK